MPLNQPDMKELRAIVDWVNLTDDVREISIKIGDVELFISRDRQSARGQSVAATASAPDVVTSSPASPALAPASAALIPSATVPWSVDALASDEVLIKAPMVGAFYGSPKPGAPAFVAVGDSVSADTVLCIMEVMKLMSNIEAHVAGIVTQILVENEQVVEYGQPLMVIKRNG